MLYLSRDFNDCSLKLKVSVLCMATEFFSSFLSHLQYLKPFLFSQNFHFPGKQGWLHVTVPHPQLLLALRSLHGAPENEDTQEAERKQMVLLEHLKEVPQVKSSGSGEKILNDPGFGQAGRTPFCPLHLALRIWLFTTQRPVLHCLKCFLAYHLPFLKINYLVLCCPAWKISTGCQLVWLIGIDLNNSKKNIFCTKQRSSAHT